METGPVVAITGHRPESMQDAQGDLQEWVVSSIASVLSDIKASRMIQGMAAGVDLWSVESAIRTRTPYICARPWAGHEARIQDRSDYQRALDNAEEIVDVTPLLHYIGPRVYYLRNEWMVNNADVVLAVYNGTTGGGTAACVRYAHKMNKHVITINPDRRIITFPRNFPNKSAKRVDKDDEQEFLF